MILDISPLLRNRDYRLLYTGQLVSAFGSMITYGFLPALFCLALAGAGDNISAPSFAARSGMKQFPGICAGGSLVWR